jgi:hypothetical protein
VIVEKLGSDDIKEIPDPPANYPSCIYCYAASKTCRFYRAGDVHFIRVEGELREVTCMRNNVVTVLACRPVTEAEANALIAQHTAYN